MKISAALILASLSLALAEPPVPSNQYLPANQYLPPQNQYLPPQNQYLPPQNQYLPPQNKYLPPAVSTSSSKYLPPATSYGAPIQTQAVTKPSLQYGAPTKTYLPPSTSYGTPSRSYGTPSRTYGTPSTTYGTPSTPSSSYGVPSSSYGAPYGRGGYEEASEPANYEFEYQVQDAASGNDFGHREQRQGDVAQGRYFVLLPDGRLQTVEYTADASGYKPRISYQQVASGGYSGGGYPVSGGAAGGYQY